MPYGIFVKKVEKLANLSSTAIVSLSEGDGMYTAQFEDGVKITGNSVSRRVLVSWGSGHTAMTLL